MILRLRLASLLIDYSMIFGSFVLAYFVRVGWVFSTDFEFGPYIIVAALTGVVWLLFLILFRVYRLQDRWNSLGHFLTLYAGSLAGVAVFGLIFFTLNKEFFSRLLLVYAYFFGIVFLTLSHLAFEMVQRFLVTRGKWVIRVLILGANRHADELVRLLLSARSHHVPIAVLDAYGSGSDNVAGVPVLGKLDKLEKVVDEHDIHEIIQVDNLEQTLNIINFCEQRGLAYAMLPSLLGAYRDHSRETIEDQSVIRVRDTGVRWHEALFGF